MMEIPANLAEAIQLVEKESAAPCQWELGEVLSEETIQELLKAAKELQEIKKDFLI